MNMIFAYAIVGTLVLLAALVDDWRSSGRTVFESGDTMLDHLVELLAALLVIIVWPIMLVMMLHALIKRMRQTADDSASNNSKGPFRVRPEDLGERLSREAVEAREHVADPLGAAPALPFGHLNAVWTAFAARLESGDELWTFEATRRYGPGVLEQQHGYVIVRSGHPADHLLCGVRQIR